MVHTSSWLVTSLVWRMAAAQTTTLQAESATLSGVSVATAVPGYTGTGYVANFDEANDKITFSIPSNSTTLYDLSLIYSGPYGDKYTSVALNPTPGASGAQVFLPATTAWTSVSAGQILLTPGTNTLEIQNNWGWYLIDAITLAPSPPRAPHNISSVPVNAKANSDAKALLSYLAANYGKKIISGQQDPKSLDWVTQNVGKTPALLGVDMMDYTDSRTSRGAVGTDVDAALAFATEKGGLLSFVWHWGAPVGLYDTEAQRWWSGFYTAATDFDISAALADETNANYTLLLHDIDTIATQLKRLQDANIPVLWRPLHEAEGGWFWWGAKGPEACKKLWRILYSRLTEHHNLNNLLWVWNSVDPAWYPGDDVVDIVSADTYQKGDHGPASATYNNLLKLTDDTKIIAATELGSVMEPELLKAYGADWSWFCVWTGEYIQDGVWNSLELLKRVYADEYVLTLDEVQGWRNGTGI